MDTCKPEKPILESSKSTTDLSYCEVFNQENEALFRLKYLGLKQVNTETVSRNSLYHPAREEEQFSLREIIIYTNYDLSKPQLRLGVWDFLEEAPLPSDGFEERTAPPVGLEVLVRGADFLGDLPPVEGLSRTIFLRP